jgi:hypothetical protein
MMPIAEVPTEVVERHAHVELECGRHCPQARTEAFEGGDKGTQILVKLGRQSALEFRKKLIEKLIVGLGTLDCSNS